jgi:uncharacterized membrane protein
MKQDAFIQALRDELGGSLPKQAVDEIVADYHEYIGDALAAGRREEDVIAALGDPVKLARELKAQANYRQWQDRRSFGNLLRVVGSVAGLGLLNMLLLVPFMVYLLVLTAGYVISGALTVAGLVALVVFGGHHLFGTPSLQGHPVKIDIVEPAASATSAASASHPADANANLVNALDEIHELRIVGDRYVIDLGEDSKLSMVTTHGAVEMRKEDGKLSLEAIGVDGSVLTKADDGTYSIARDDVIALDLKSDSGAKVSLARTGKDAKSVVWDVKNSDGDRVKLTQGEHGQSRMIVRSGDSTVSIGGGEVAVNDGHGSVRVSTDDHDVTVSKWKSSTGVLLLPVGIAGLLLCVWLTRITWRGLARYVKQQIDRVSSSIERDHAA